jgi:hypothetical protein
MTEEIDLTPPQPKLFHLRSFSSKPERPFKYQKRLTDTEAFTPDQVIFDTCNIIDVVLKIREDLKRLDESLFIFKEGY